MKKHRRDQKNQPTFSVASLCDEPSALVLSYVAHYLNLGALEIFLYFDTADKECQAALAKFPNVHTYVCNAETWKHTIGVKRPSSSRDRQLEIANHAYLNTNAAWFAHLDVDEFLVSKKGVTSDLKSAAPDVPYITIPNVERVFVEGTPRPDIFGGVFRRSTVEGSAENHEIYGGAAKYLNNGMTGYHLGKAFVRTGLKLVPGIHKPRAYKNLPNLKYKAIISTDLTLLHYDGLTGFHWGRKLLRYANSPKDLKRKKKGPDFRFQQMEFALENIAEGAESIRTLHNRLQCLSEKAINQLEENGLLFCHDLGIENALQSVGLLEKADLTASSFDKAISEKHPELSSAFETWSELDATQLRKLEKRAMKDVLDTAAETADAKKYKNLHQRHHDETDVRVHSNTKLAETVLSFYKPKRIVDVGCGIGILMKCFEDQGRSVTGVEGPWLTDENCVCDPGNYIRHDLETPYHSEKTYDMAVSIEVAEHLEPARAESFVDDLTALSEVVLFSAAIKGQSGAGHKNEQWQEYWATLFEDKGYNCFDPVRHVLKRDEIVQPWFKQNTLVFVKSGHRLEKKLAEFRITPQLANAIVPEYHFHIAKKLRHKLRNARRSK